VDRPPRDESMADWLGRLDDVFLKRVGDVVKAEFARRRMLPWTWEELVDLQDGGAG
jgi:hypothetical protein